MSVSLAEPRRKEKHGPDPRNTFWSNDESKFGFRMLESMGWKKGKGLGAKETGITEHLKAGNRKNSDVRGFGCSKKDAENWIAHQDDFDSILASLNESADPGDASSQPTESLKASHAMEEKSRSSRSRVHYHKFIQSKDLSTRSTEDLNCIFGRRKKPSEKSAAATSTTSSEANSDENSSSDDQKNSAEDAASHGVKTITSSCSVQEYFARKMAELQQKMRPATTTDTDIATESNCNDSETTVNHCDKNNGRREPDGAEVSASEDSGLTEKQKRKKKKKKQRQENDVSREDQLPGKSGDSCAESCQEPSPVCVDEQQSSKSKKKEKRRKKRGSSEPDSVNSSQPGSAEEPDTEVSQEAEQPTARKAKIRKSARLNAAATEQEKTDELGQIGICEDSDEATQKKKKKKKKKKQKEEEEEDAHNSSILLKEKDDKSRRRKSVRFSTGTAEVFMIPNKEEEKAQQEEEEVVSKKPSRKRKRKKNTAEEETETSVSADKTSVSAEKTSVSAESQTAAERGQEGGEESVTEEDHLPKKKKT